MLSNCFKYSNICVLVDSDCTNYSTRTTCKYLEELFTKKNFKYKLLR